MRLSLQLDTDSTRPARWWVVLLVWLAVILQLLLGGLLVLLALLADLRLPG